MTLCEEKGISTGKQLRGSRGRVVGQGRERSPEKLIILFTYFNLTVKGSGTYFT